MIIYLHIFTNDSAFMETIIILIFILILFWAQMKFPQFVPKPNYWYVAFFFLIFYDSVFKDFTIWKFIAFMVLIASVFFQTVNRRRNTGEENLENT